MPHITEQRRIAMALGHRPKNSGELNYKLTRLAILYLEDKGLSYATINDIAGAFTQALAVFNERVTHPYECYKAMQNGDVYKKVDDEIMRFIYEATTS